jgi:two-component system CheB/CheR fusion protein
VPVRFLLVEDDYVLRAACGRELRAYGDCVEAASAEEVDESELAAWDAFVIDICLPGKSGIELLERIRHAGIRAPVLLFSGAMRGEVVNEASRLDARCLSKPFPRDELRKFASAAASARMTDRKERVVERARSRWELTPAETEILELSLSGSSPKQIWERRGNSPNTHKTLVLRRLLKKTGHKSLGALTGDLLRGTIAYS